jgi:IS1 family transposase
MTSWSLFPPQTREVQFDEKWSFVTKKEKHTDPEDPAAPAQGDQWDHVALDPEHRLVVSVVVGKRTEEHTRLLVEDFYARTEGRPMNLMTSDEHAPYAAVILEVYGEEVVPPRTGKPGRPAGPRTVPPEDLQYATVHKTRENNRVVQVEARVVYGTEAGVQQALERSSVSPSVNTSFVERHNGTDRHRNARKGRKTYRFSKDWGVHAAMTHLSYFSYTFCWPVRTLRQRGSTGRWESRTPAMAAGLADHAWKYDEWFTYPAVQR